MTENPNVVKMGQHYPVATEDRARVPGGAPAEVRARWTGEKRAPRAGEWYLSGAIVEAWQAPNDLSTAFHIAVLVRPETTITRWVEIEA